MHLVSDLSLILFSRALRVLSGPSHVLGNGRQCGMNLIRLPVVSIPWPGNRTDFVDFCGKQKRLPLLAIKKNILTKFLQFSYRHPSQQFCAPSVCLLLCSVLRVLRLRWKFSVLRLVAVAPDVRYVQISTVVADQVKAGPK